MSFSVLCAWQGVLLCRGVQPRYDCNGGPIWIGNECLTCWHGLQVLPYTLTPVNFLHTSINYLHSIEDLVDLPVLLTKLVGQEQR